MQARLDRFISTRTGIHRRDVRRLLAQGRVTVDGELAIAINQVINQFSQILIDKQVLQAQKRSYVMLHKPVGVVSATTDKKHRTVVDLVDRPDQPRLHIAGRLDFNSTGLLLLTNDGRWSQGLSAPKNNISKLYRVTLEKPISVDCIEAFARGMYFNYEGIMTRPARLKIIGEYQAEVRLLEGRYHQIKRMFGRFGNRVLKLHRTAIGNLQLDASLEPGQYRELTVTELDGIAG